MPETGAAAALACQGFAMSPPKKPISLSDIHDVYRGTAKKEETADAAPSYQKTDRFARDAGHPGVARNRPPVPPGRKAR
jgi:hypothetical protein